MIIINHYNKKVKQRFSNKKDFIKNFFIVIEKNSGVLRLNQIVSKSLAVSKCLHLIIVMRNGKIVWKHGPRLAEF